MLAVGAGAGAMAGGKCSQGTGARSLMKNPGSSLGIIGKVNSARAEARVPVNCNARRQLDCNFNRTFQTDRHSTSIKKIP